MRCRDLIEVFNAFSAVSFDIIEIKALNRHEHSYIFKFDDLSRTLQIDHVCEKQG